MFLSLLGARSCPKWSGVSIALTVENRIFARGSPGVRSSNASHVRKVAEADYAARCFEKEARQWNDEATIRAVDSKALCDNFINTYSD